MFVFPELKYISRCQEPEAIIVPGQGRDATVSLDAGSLHPPVVQATLAARWTTILLIWKKSLLYIGTEQARHICII